MFSDSHAHFFMIFKRNEGDASFLHTMMERKFRFAMDIGTQPGDLKERQKFISEVFEGKIQGQVPALLSLPDFMHFAAGLWPHAESIAEPEKALAALKADIGTLFLQKAEAEKTNPGKPFYCGLGECGLDRYWNGPAAEKRGGDLKIEFFIGENGKINFLPGAYWNRQKMIELDKTEEKPEINPSYEALGLPSDKDYAIYYAGESYDEESLRFAMRKVIGLYEAKKIDYKMLNAGIMHPYVNGEEQVVGADTFLIIPKYKNARISAFYEYYDEKSDKRIIESHYPVLQTVGDTVFLCKAASESPGNVHIVVEYAGKRVEYIPTIELKDGKSVTPREAVNLNEEIVKIEPAALDNEKAKTLFTMFFDFVPKG